MSAATDRPVSSERRPPGASDSPPGDRLLVVEDSAAQALQLKELLEAEGYVVGVATTGAEALAMLAEHLPKAVLSDVLMPGMDGYDLCRKIKADLSLAGVPVLLVTGLSDPGDVIMALECGADAFITKPYRKEDLIERIRLSLADDGVHGEDPADRGVEISFAGRRHRISSGRQQILNLLLSTFAAAVLRNLDLERAREELEALNATLDEEVLKHAGALVTSELRYRRLFEAAQDGILILDAATGAITDVNPYLANLLGLRSDQIIGQYPWDLGPFRNILATRDALAEVQEKGYVRYENLPLEASDGSLVPVEFVSNSYMVDGRAVIQCNIRDISDRRQAERRDALTRDVLRALNSSGDTAETIREILALVKEQCGIEAVGLRLDDGDDFPYVETSGFPGEFVEKERFLCERDGDGGCVHDPQGRPVLECMCGNVIRGRTDPALPFFTEGGSFWCNSTTDLLAATTVEGRQSHTRNHCNGAGYESVALIPLRVGDEILGLLQLNDHRRGRFSPKTIGFFEALCGSIAIGLARRRAHEALVRSQGQLVQAQKMEAVGRLAGGVAHDFNNVLQVLLSNVETLGLDAAPATVAGAVREMEGQIRRGADMTKQLLLFSRRQQAERVRLDLGELATATGVLLRRLIPKNVRLTVETASAPIWVDVAAVQLQQVLMNLAVNANDAMPDGGTLTIRVYTEPGAAVAEVIDTGDGMDAAAREHLFDPFFTTKQAGDGSGLGLAVVHGIIDEHGGRIEVESVPGEGSRFRVILPAMPPPPGEAPEAAGAVALPRGHGERILVVDDEEGARNGLSRLLTMLGYEVSGVATGEEAGALPVEPVPDLLLTDLTLPGIGGAALAVGLRDRWPDMKVVLMSGYARAEMLRGSAGAGDACLLQKPFDAATLARAVESSLGGAARHDEATP